MKVTMKDVAKKASVSPSTVSRVISGNEKISEKTRKKVLKIMKELDYHPNISARNLAINKTKTLGLILPNATQEFIHNPFFIKSMAGISNAAKENDYYIMYGNAKNEKEEVKLLKHFARAGVVDGVILTHVRSDDKSIKLLRDLNFPYITIGRQKFKDSLWVDNDNISAMYKVVSYLINKGNKNISFIGGDHKLTVTIDRLKGYKKALNKYDLKIDSKLIKEIGFTKSDGYNVVKSLLKDKPSIDAVVTTDDLLAFGVLNFLEEEGLNNKVSVAGFNNTPLSKYRKPTLTSVDINAQKLGYYAAKLLIQKLNDSKIDRKNKVIDTQLIKRESTL